MHGEELVIGGNPIEAQRLVDLMNEQRSKKLGGALVDVSKNGAAMDPYQVENGLLDNQGPPRKYSVE
jgi:hypothetical protein